MADVDTMAPTNGTNSLGDTLMAENNLMTEAQLCELLDLSKATVQTWRSLRRGPAWIKVGRNIFYDRRKVDAWLDSQTCDPA
jgi:predicted DNA-binding transcriptional regulator AlpA